MLKVDASKPPQSDFENFSRATVPLRNVLQHHCFDIVFIQRNLAYVFAENNYFNSKTGFHILLYFRAQKQKGETLIYKKGNFTSYYGKFYLIKGEILQYKRGNFTS